MKTYYPRFRYQFREAFSYLSAVMLTEGKGEQKDQNRYYCIWSVVLLVSSRNSPVPKIQVRRAFLCISNLSVCFAPKKP